jgi:hypothetical protein
MRMADEETTQTQPMMLWQFATPGNSAVHQQPIIIAPFMTPPPLTNIGLTPTSIQSMYQQLLPQVSGAIAVQQDSTPAPRPGVISPPVGKKESTESKKPIHVSVVSPVRKESGHTWSPSPTSGSSSSKHSSKTSERRGSVIMGVGSSTPTKNSHEKRDFRPIRSAEKVEIKQEVTSSDHDITGGHRSARSPSKSARMVVPVDTSSIDNNHNILTTSTAVVWAPPETPIVNNNSGGIILHEMSPKLTGKTPPIHTRFPSLEPKVDLRKRRGKKPADIDAFVVPLRKGWRRETMIRSHTKADVCYTTPCGRRLRAYQEVTRYLELNHITDLTVDNFSFSTKIMVGQFLESREDGSSWRVLTDDEIASKNLTVDKRLLGCKKRKVSADGLPNATAIGGGVVTHVANSGMSDHTPINPTHSDHSLVDSSHSDQNQAEQSQEHVQRSSSHSPNLDHTHHSTSAGNDSDVFPESLPPHTTIVTISPTDVAEPIANGNTVFVDNQAPSDGQDSVSVTMPTIVPSTVTPAPQAQSSSSEAKGMVVYPRKRGRKRKDEGGSTIPIHLPRKRGNSISRPEPAPAKRRGRPPKVVNQSMQSMTSHFETHQSNAKKILPGASSTSASGGHRIQVMVGGGHQPHIRRDFGGKRTPRTSTSHHPSEAVFKVKKKLGRPRKEEAELRRKEEIRLRAEKIRRKAEKLAQSKAMKKLIKEEKLEADRQRRVMVNHLAKQREQEDLQYRRSRVVHFQEQEQRRKQRELSLNLIERNKQFVVEDKMRMEQQMLEFEIQYQLKKPIEDLELERVSGLPAFQHMGTACLSSTAFANMQVVYEFIMAFREFLGFEEVPSFPKLCGSLHNVGREIFFDVFVHLLKPLLNDFGGKTTVLSGASLGDIELTPSTASEMFRVLVTMTMEDVPNKVRVVITKLESESVSGLRPSDKAAILNFVVDSLLMSSSLVREIDSRMEMMSNLRREKWKVNLKLKKFRTCFNTVHTTAEEAAVMMKPPPYKGRGRPPKRPQIVRDTIEDDSSDEEEGHDGEGDDPVINEDVGEVSPEESDEDLPRTKDRLEGRIKKLKRKQAQIRSLLNRMSNKMRSFSLGNDRYTRSYWQLPTLGGVYVEGVDSYPSTLNLWGAIDQDAVEEDTPVSQEEEGGSSTVPVKSETVGKGAMCDAMPDTRVKVEVDPATRHENKEKSVPVTDGVQLPGASVEPVASMTTPIGHTLPVSSTKATSKHTPMKDTPTSHTFTKDAPTGHTHPDRTLKDKSSFGDLTNQSTSAQVPISPSSTSVTMTIHSPTGVGMVTGTMEVTPVATPNVRSSVITTASLSGDETSKKELKEEVSVYTSQNDQDNNSSVWFSILPRESCAEPCDMDKLIARCTNGNEEGVPNMVNMDTSNLPGYQPTQNVDTSDAAQGNNGLPMSQYSYMYVQTPEGETQLCLVENSVMPYLQTVTLQMEVPSVVVMESEMEAVPYGTPITVEAGRWQTFHHNFQQMMTTLESKQFRAPTELLETVVDDKKNGWWFVEKGADIDLLIKKLSSRGYRERNLCKTLSKVKALVANPPEENGPQKMREMSQAVLEQYTGESDVAMETNKDTTAILQFDNLFPEENKVQMLLVSQEIRGIEERLFAANLEKKGSSQPCSALEERLNGMSDNEEMLRVVGECLLKIQEIVDNQYLNAPLNEEGSPAETPSANGSEVQSSVLDMWKSAVTTATSASQLAVCMVQLDKFIAWEKSLLKVFCTSCHKADDEANLLLCDGCDRGTHTYCCKPKLYTVPAGDWFCANCVSTVSLCSIVVLVRCGV